MRAKPVLVTLAGILAIVAVVWAVHRWETPSHPTICQICDRAIPKQTAFQIETDHGTIFACCPRCAMHNIVNHPGEARKELATDLNTGRWISAQSAYYDEGGNVQYCTHQHPSLERVPDQGVSMRVYDRCLPVLVAFASRDEAEAYRQQHGGRVVTYNEALEDVAGKQP